MHRIRLLSAVVTQSVFGLQHLVTALAGFCSSGVMICTPAGASEIHHIRLVGVLCKYDQASDPAVWVYLGTECLELSFTTRLHVHELFHHAHTVLEFESTTTVSCVNPLTRGWLIS